MATVTLSKLLANFETSLASKMTIAATTCTLVTSTDDEGNTFSGNYMLTFDEGTSTEEHMIVTLAGASGTVVRRGLNRTDGWTEVTANKFEHRRGASVKITTFALMHLNRLLNGDDTFNSVAWTGVASISGLSTPTAGETTKAANVAYVNAVAIAGASDANTTTKGIVEQATLAETKAGTATGGTGAKLFATPADSASAIQDSSWVYAADSVGTDSYAITLVPAITAYTTGQRFIFKAGTANTGACTLNVNALGAKTIKKQNDQDTETGDIESGSIVEVVYDGTNMQMVTPIASLPTTALLTEAANFFSTTSMTGANAETLISNGDASALHNHTSLYTNTAATNVGTRDVSLTTDLVIPHTLGVAPKIFKLKMTFSSATAENYPNSWSDGVYIDGTQSAIYYVADGVDNLTQAPTGIIGSVGKINGTRNDATVGTVDATNVTITWSKVGSPTGTAVYQWEAYKYI